jgi:phosphoribosylanthranilate isomerase
LKTGIKICGITRVEDAQAAIDAGADMLGLNFTTVSPRRVSVERAREIVETAAGRASMVGLFLDQPAAFVSEVLDQVSIDLLQFHGEEPHAYCRAFERPYMKVFRVSEPFDAARAASRYPDAWALLLDAFVAGVPGGTGQRIALEHWPDASTLPLVLAGGLTPENVAEAVRRVRPFAVDVSGGVESGTKGHKDHQKMVEFVAAVRSVDEASDTTMFQKH